MSFTKQINAHYKVTSASAAVRIGYTTSGKEVFDTFDNPAHQKFSSDDHKDAMFIHAYLFKVKHRKESEAEGRQHEKRCSPRSQKAEPFDCQYGSDHGKKLVDKNFR